MQYSIFLIYRILALCISIITIIVSSISLTKSVIAGSRKGSQLPCGKSYNDNIGYRSYFDSMCFSEIDAVYTWVNGSDPVWFAEMQYYKSIYRKEHNITNLEENNAISLNRFRDNDELK